VQTYLDAPTLLRELHKKHQLDRPRSFDTFLSRTRIGLLEMRNMEFGFTSPPAPLPIGCGEGSEEEFVPPTPERLRALEARLDRWFITHNRGGHCRVFMFPDAEECLFRVRHGPPCRRESAIKDGESTSIFYRPQTHDVVGYTPDKGELRLHCCGKRERTEFRKAFGHCLFGDEEFFPGDEKYRLDPLVSDGPAALVCSDVPGIEHVALVEVAFKYPIVDHEVVHKSKDVFSLVEGGAVKWPPVRCITRATFAIKFADSKKARRVTLLAPNRALYGRDEDSAAIDQWLKARGFAANETDDETTTLAMA